MTEHSVHVLDIMLARLPFLAPCLGYAALWLALRFVFYKAFRTYWNRKPHGHRLKDVGLQEKVLEESYAIVGSLVAFTLGWHALKDSDRGGCGLRNTSQCLAGWPDPQVVGQAPPSIALYHTVELGWYLHYLLKHALGIGMEDNLQMHLHHASTVVLLLLSYSADFYRAGVLVLFVLNMSNPFLHVAKVLHYAEAPGDKVAFLAFALAFFISRIVIYPAVVLRATIWEGWQVNPIFSGPGVPRVLYLAANLLLSVLMMLQIFWFLGILRVLRMALGGDKDGYKKETKAHDYAVLKEE